VAKIRKWLEKKAEVYHTQPGTLALDIRVIGRVDRRTTIIAIRRGLHEK